MGIFASRIRVDQRYLADRLEQTLRNFGFDQIVPSIKDAVTSFEGIAANVDEITGDFNYLTAGLVRSVTLLTTYLFGATLAYIVFLTFLVICITYCARLYRQATYDNGRKMYIAHQYGRDADSIGTSCIRKIKHQSSIIRERTNLPDTVDIKVLPVDTTIINEGVEAVVHDRRLKDPELAALLLPTYQISFRSIQDAMNAAAQFDSSRGGSGGSNPQTFYIFLLFPSYDPRIVGPRHHDPFNVPWALSTMYAIVGMGANGGPAHSLSSRSTATIRKKGIPQVESLIRNHSLEFETVGIAVHDDRFVLKRVRDALTGSLTPVYQGSTGGEIVPF